MLQYFILISEYILIITKGALFGKHYDDKIKVRVFSSEVK